MTVLGLTGGIGSGKSTVSRLFASHGFDIVDADVITRSLHHDPAICIELAHLFGPAVLDHSADDVCVNRRNLAQIVFNSAEALSALNRLMQPALCRKLQETLKLCSNHAVVDAALLLEAGWDAFVEKTIVVLCPIEIRIDRVKKRDDLPESQIHSRIAAQMSDSDRLKRADLIIYNTHNPDTLARQVNHICAAIL